MTEEKDRWEIEYEEYLESGKDPSDFILPDAELVQKKEDEEDGDI